ncbi:DUF1329 domain-containing protein [Pseudomonas sp. LA21]|uniref:DUF1329 domain-containing protein n=1 Tax=unclassified Pseudomonas TaxID=196821 RepID=UPI001FB76415|nr:DUF1329 domain-containing protein [Pseudomonas sp. LA21]MCJ1887037.1 DUF1329 domain-containing protein [Pseudomonas sp. LA21]
MKNNLTLGGSALALSLLASSALAAISPQEADKLGTSLTPMGAQKEGNTDGSIPAWTGGLKPGAAPVQNGFLGDPYASEKPQFIITAANAEQYKDKLTPGQLALFKRYPDSYKIPVYPTHRSAAAPQAVYDAIKKGATQVQLINDGNGLSNFETHYTPFPIPKSGVEVVWNHETRYRGNNFLRFSFQVVPQVNGDFTAVGFKESVGFPQAMSDNDPAKTGNIMYYYKQEIIAPSRLTGTVNLAYETIDQLKEPRQAWTYNAGQRRVRRAPEVAYDGPGSAADGMRTADNSDLYNGSPDRYDWKLIGKRELYIPYNSYRMMSPKLKLADLVRPGHLNPDNTRYELHRVWEVEGTLKPGARHVYAKRHMYFDEDTWTLAEVDHYDSRGQLWRVAEGHQAADYQQGISLYAAQALYDLVAGRYLVMNLINEAKQGTQYDQQYTVNDFTPAALRNSGIR